MARATALPRSPGRLALVGTVQHEAPAGGAVPARRGGASGEGEMRMAAYKKHCMHCRKCFDVLLPFTRFCSVECADLGEKYRYPEIDTHVLCQEYRSGATLLELHARYGIVPSSIIRRFERVGMPRRERGRPRGRAGRRGDGNAR
jgi:hypothetical protein